MKYVYVVLHEHTSRGDRDHVKLIGVYSSDRQAKRAIERLRSAPGFADAPEGFAIDKYEVDQDNWVEGYGKPLNRSAKG